METLETEDAVQIITKEALIAMFNMLSTHQILSLCSIDNGIQNFVKNYITNRIPSIEKILNFKELNSQGKLITPQFIHMITNLFKNVTDVHLQMDITSFKFCQTDYFEKLFLFENLERLTITNIDTNNIQKMNKSRDLCIFNIKHLKLKTMHYSFVIRLLDVLELITPRKINKLKEFKYANNKLTAKSIHNISSKNLEQISLKNTLLTENTAVITLIKESPNLKTIKMHYSRENHIILTEPLQIQYLIENIKLLKKLEYLKITVFKSTETLDFRDVLKVKSLQRIYMLYESNVNLTYILNTLNQTEHFIQIMLTEVINWKQQAEGYTAAIQTKINEMKSNPNIKIVQLQCPF